MNRYRDLLSGLFKRAIRLGMVTATRTVPNDPTEPVVAEAYRTVARPFGRAVEQARRGLSEQGKDATQLHGYTWHANRHTFASHLATALARNYPAPLERADAARHGVS